MDALYYGFFGSNVGDLAVTRGALTLLRDHLGLDQGVLVSPPLNRVQRAGWKGSQPLAPGVTLRHWDPALLTLASEAAPTLSLVDALLAEPILDAVAAASGALNIDRAFYLGGEHLFSDGSPMADWLLLGRLLPLLAAQKLGRDVRTLPSTYGPFGGAFGETLFERFRAGLSRPLLCRDDRSRDAFGRDAVSGLDPAFFLRTGSRARKPPKHAPLRVGVVMRLNGFGLRLGAAASKVSIGAMRQGGVLQTEAGRLAREIVSAALDAGHDVTVFVQCMADRELAHALKAWDDRINLTEPASLAQYVREISFMDAVFTSRFHSAIFALMVGTTPAGLYFAEHGHKMPGLFQQFDLDDLVTRVDGATSGREVFDNAVGYVRARAGAPPPWLDRLSDLRTRTIEAMV